MYRIIALYISGCLILFCEGDRMNPMGMLAVGLLLCSGVYNVLHADTPKEYKEQEALAEKLFKAYNKDDAKGVFNDYIDALKGNADQIYNVLFKPNKEKYGNYKSHAFIKDGSVATDEVVLLMLHVEFDKAKKVKVAFNFSKEGKNWKIQQVTFDPQ
jgi:hypothetical protein